MSEWWTYTLSDFLLFSPRTYLRLIELYQRDVWPLQIVTVSLGAVLIALALRGGPSAGRIVALILAALWTFVGFAFHIERYATVNWAASYFGAAFIVEAALIVWLGTLRTPLALGSPRGVADCVAVALPVFAVAGDPLLGRSLGRAWPEVEVFGVTPDATAIATLGVLLIARRPALMVIPALWCLLSGALSWAMEMPDALVPPVTAGVALVLAWRKR